MVINKHMFVITLLFTITSKNIAMDAPNKRVRFDDESEKIVWVDLETTGLNPDKQTILEIACIVTDCDLNILEEGPVYVIQQPESVLQNMEKWPQEHHEKSGLTAKVRAEGIPMAQAEEQTLSLIKRHCIEKKAFLGGNSIAFDKAFMERHMPRIINFLHYQMIDVTSLKILVRNWYPDDPNNRLEKKGAHRSSDDIHESIEELRHFRKYFFIPKK
jgi:oligoribonuclease